MSSRTMEAAKVTMLEAAIAKYGWIWLGVLFGFAAKYGLIMKRGKPVTIRMMVADLLMIGIVALVAYSIVSRIGVTDEGAALVTALVAVGADRGIQRLADRFWRQIDAALPDPRDVIAGERQRAQLQRSAEQLSGRADYEGEDTSGLHAHRLPAMEKKQ